MQKYFFDQREAMKRMLDARRELVYRPVQTDNSKDFSKHADEFARNIWGKIQKQEGPK